jgi:hypothetical protein
MTLADDIAAEQGRNQNRPRSRGRSDVRECHGAITRQDDLIVTRGFPMRSQRLSRTSVRQMSQAKSA